VTVTLDFEAIGAPWQIETAEAMPAALVDAIFARIEEYDATWSRFRADSLVARIAMSPGTYSMPADAAPLLALYRRLYDATGGAVTPLVGRALEGLGYDRDYTLKPAADAASIVIPAWDDAMQWDAAASTLTTAIPVTLDVGAAGKGYLADIVAGLLRDNGIDEYLIDASGDLVHRGARAVRVGLEHPFDSSLAIGVYELANGALCASAPGRRAWGTALTGDLHHILDGLTGRPTGTVAATWAIAPTGLLADGLATALFFASGETLAAEFDFKYVRMFPDSRVEHSPDFEGELFT
jgi:thiamine biosynthesis lipoprotein